MMPDQTIARWHFASGLGGTSRSKDMTMNKLLHTLFMIRLGQELGTDSQAARAVADTIDLLAGMARFFCS